MACEVGIRTLNIGQIFEEIFHRFFGPEQCTVLLGQEVQFPALLGEKVQRRLLLGQQKVTRKPFMPF